MEFTPRGEHVWISARDDNKVLIYDTATFERSASLPRRRRAASSSPAVPTAPDSDQDARRGARLSLLNDFQRDFPLCSAPLPSWRRGWVLPKRRSCGCSKALRREGKIARVGAVFAPKRIGASTLAAMAVPPEKLAAAAEAVNRFPEVNHNYEREHRYNLWFVVTAGSEGRLQAALGAIEQAAGWPLLRLPLLQEYHIDLGFSLDGKGQKPATSGGVRRQPFVPPKPLDEFERRLVMALQEGLPLFIRPFSVLASRVGCDESEVSNVSVAGAPKASSSASESSSGTTNSAIRPMRCWCTTSPTPMSARSARGWPVPPE
jgi:DNA-binding Lrp family transcriptional regulator